MADATRTIDVDDDIWKLFREMALDDEPRGSVAADDSTRRDMECGFCGADDVVLEEGNYVCRSCFSLVSRFIDSSPEWRYYGCDDTRSADPTRCGPPVNELLPSLGSVIAPSGGDSHAMRMMQKYQFWNSMTYRERSLYNAFDQMAVNAAANGIPTCIVEEAKALYKRLTDAKISRGENRHALVASTVYMSCKSNGVPRSVKEVAAMFGIKPMSMTKSCKQLQQMMASARVKSSSPDDFIARFCSRLGQDESVNALCRYVVGRADDLCVVCESTPPSMVAGAIYLCNSVLKLGITKAQLSEACHISQVTINKCYKRLSKHRGVLLPDDMAALALAKKTPSNSSTMQQIVPEGQVTWMSLKRSASMNSTSRIRFGRACHMCFHRSAKNAMSTTNIATHNTTRIAHAVSVSMRSGTTYVVDPMVHL